MCQHFCFGGIILIIAFTVVFAIALYFNLKNEFRKPMKANHLRSAREHHVINNSDLNYLLNSINTCERLYSTSGADNQRENFVTNDNEYFPLVVQLNYRTKDKIENLCNGVVIHSNYILTLAQCLIDNTDRELISVTINTAQNAPDQNYKITDIYIYEETMNQTKNLPNDIGLIKIEKAVDVTNQFCTRRVENIDDKMRNVSDGTNLRLMTCNYISKVPNSVCVKTNLAPRLGDPLIEKHQDGQWYLIGLYQAPDSFSSNISIYTNVYLYKNWIGYIIQPNT